MTTRGRTLRRDLVTILGASAILLVARASFADHYRVPSGSMEPTVDVGDQVCVDKLAYGLRVPFSGTYLTHSSGPARGDVVVLTSPDDGEVLLKRVVALPGDVVTVHDGQLTLNGAAVPVVDEPDGGAVEQLGAHAHMLDTDFGGGPDFGPVRVPEGRLLVLGDNRGNSRDGRYFGWVSRDALLGRAVAVCMREGRPVWRPL
jgi:signal peptidase I